MESYFSVQKMSPAVHILSSHGSRGDLNPLRAQCSLINCRISLLFTDLSRSFSLTAWAFHLHVASNLQENHILIFQLSHELENCF